MQSKAASVSAQSDCADSRSLHRWFGRSVSGFRILGFGLKSQWSVAIAFPASVGVGAVRVEVAVVGPSETLILAHTLRKRRLRRLWEQGRVPRIALTRRRQVVATDDVRAVGNAVERPDVEGARRRGHGQAMVHVPMDLCLRPRVVPEPAVRVEGSGLMFEG